MVLLPQLLPLLLLLVLLVLVLLLLQPLLLESGGVKFSVGVPDSRRSTCTVSHVATLRSQCGSSSWDMLAEKRYSCKASHKRHNRLTNTPIARARTRMQTYTQTS
jgi:hypothetical protein